MTSRQSAFASSRKFGLPNIRSRSARAAWIQTSDMHLTWIWLLFGFIGPVLLETTISQATTPSDCKDVSADKCILKLQALSHIHSLPYTSDENELDDICDTVSGGYNCSTGIVNSECITDDERALLTRFIQFGEDMFKLLCRQQGGELGLLREAYLNHSACVQQQKKSMDCCVQESKVADIPDLTMLNLETDNITVKAMATCCPLSYYLKCTSDVIKSNCGDSAENFTTTYIRFAAGREVQLLCQSGNEKFPEPDERFCHQGSLQACSGGASGRVHFELLTLLSLVGLLFVSKRL